jgi:hypothetical protein
VAQARAAAEQPDHGGRLWRVGALLTCPHAPRRGRRERRLWAPAKSGEWRRSAARISPARCWSHAS